MIPPFLLRWNYFLNLRSCPSVIVNQFPSRLQTNHEWSTLIPLYIVCQQTCRARLILYSARTIARCADAISFSVCRTRTVSTTRITDIIEARTLDIHSSIRARSLPAAASTRYLGCNGGFGIAAFSSFSTSVVRDDGTSSTVCTGDLGNRSGRNVRLSHAFNRARLPSPSVPVRESWRDPPPLVPMSVRVSARARLKGFEVVSTSS